MAGRVVGGWRDTDVTVVLHARQVGKLIEALALAQVHVDTCLGLAPTSSVSRKREIQDGIEALALALGEKISDRPNNAKWRELLSDHIRAYALAMWRGWNGGGE